MKVHFINDCAIDGCYKKRTKESDFCKAHHYDIFI